MVGYRGEILACIYKGNSCVYIWGEFLCALNVGNFCVRKGVREIGSETFFGYRPAKSRKNKEKMETVRLSTI
jgi:hypothetical protein